jgi:uncharacterized repeat protein (TIGR03803 family)
MLSPDGGNNTWTETVLHSFDGSDGLYPDSNLISDPAGNLYGTAGAGGQTNLGTVFKLSPSINGDWTTTILLEFNATNGASPKAVTFGRGGSLYGTTSLGGDLNACESYYGKGCGLVFSLIP